MLLSLPVCLKLNLTLTGSNQIQLPRVHKRGIYITDDTCWLLFYEGFELVTSSDQEQSWMFFSLYFTSFVSFKVQVDLELGHTAQLWYKGTLAGFAHDWTVFV